MTSPLSPGARFRAALDQERPLQVPGVMNAYAAIMAERTGFKALYVSGAGVANASFGKPDIGLTSLEDVLEDVRRIAGATHLPLLVDIDTGWESKQGVAETVRRMIEAGAAAVHLEDQVEAKRCGHLPNKTLVSCAEMEVRVRHAVEAKTDPDFVVMARTDAATVEGLEAAIERAARYVEAGADMIFAESLGSLDEYETFCTAIRVPALANMTEFGLTPLFHVDELSAAGIRLVLYPLSAFRAMNAAALSTYRTLRKEGIQRRIVSTMQSRVELYDFLRYTVPNAGVDERQRKDEEKDGTG